MDEKYYVKICGITSTEDARLANAAGADLFGFVLHPLSKRRCDIEVAAEIFAELKAKPKVLVFGHDDKEWILSAYERLRSLMTFIQMPANHESFFELTKLLGPQKIIPSIQIKEETDDEDLAAYENHSLLVLDTPGDLGSDGKPVAGGTGKTFNWEFVTNISRPFLLAGGLNCENICQAIRKVAPLGFDVAGGLEKSPGKKDPALVKRFFEIVRSPERNCP